MIIIKCQVKILLCLLWTRIGIAYTVIWTVHISQAVAKSNLFSTVSHYRLSYHHNLSPPILFGAKIIILEVFTKVHLHYTAVRADPADCSRCTSIARDRKPVSWRRLHPWASARFAPRYRRSSSAATSHGATATRTERRQHPYGRATDDTAPAWRRTRAKPALRSWCRLRPPAVTTAAIRPGRWTVGRWTPARGAGGAGFANRTAAACWSKSSVNRDRFRGTSSTSRSHIAHSLETIGVAAVYLPCCWRLTLWMKTAIPSCWRSWRMHKTRKNTTVEWELCATDHSIMKMINWQHFDNMLGLGWRSFRPPVTVSQPTGKKHTRKLWCHYNVIFIVSNWAQFSTGSLKYYKKMQSWY